MDNTVILGIVRHVLTAVGGWLVASGFLSQGDVEGWIGLVMTAIGVIWSIYDKLKKKDVSVVTPTSLISEIIAEPIAVETPIVMVAEAPLKETPEPRVVKKYKAKV